MRRLLTRVIHRVLLCGRLKPAMGIEAEVHTQGQRRLVVGLGNTGMEGTRHNVGMSVLGALAARLGVADRWRGDKHVSGEVILSEVAQTHVVLLRPRLLMNINGVSVAKAAAKYGIKPEHILLVHDELDKPLGKIAIKHGGSASFGHPVIWASGNEVFIGDRWDRITREGSYMEKPQGLRIGHNGVRSCVDCLHTDVMPRLRVGIGRPEGQTVERHVLGRFSTEEKKVLNSVLVQSVDILLSQLSQQGSSSPSSPAGGRQAAQKTPLPLTAEPNSET